MSPSEESATATSQMYLQKQLIITIQQPIFFVSNLGISAAAAILKITWKQCYDSHINTINTPGYYLVKQVSYFVTGVELFSHIYYCFHTSFIHRDQFKRAQTVTFNADVEINPWGECMNLECLCYHTTKWYV